TTLSASPRWACKRLLANGDRYRACIDAFLAFVDVDRLHRAGLGRFMRHLRLHHLEDKEHIARLHVVAGFDQYLPDIARHLGYHVLSHGSSSAAQRTLLSLQTPSILRRSAWASSTLTDLKRRISAGLAWPSFQNEAEGTV